MSEQSTMPRRQLAHLAALGALFAATPALGQAAGAAAKKAAKPEGEAVEALKALIDEHNKAFSAHDVKGVLKTFTPNAIIIGTAPGEIWAGPEEIAFAYGHFFADFDPGKQVFEPLWRDGGIRGDMAWFMASHKVSLTKGTKVHEFGSNMSVTFEKVDGKWLVRALHFSNLVGGAAPAQEKKS